MTSEQCKGTTASGEPCSLKPGLSGYCHIHNPEKIAERMANRKAAQEKSRTERERLEQVINIVKEVSAAKGWSAVVVSHDSKTWRYATIEVSRYLSSNHTSGSLEITVSDKIKIIPHSNWAYKELSGLVIDIWDEVNKLPWIVPHKKDKSSESKSEIQQLEQLIKRFHLVARQLTHRHDNRDTLIISDEYDVQDLLCALLKVGFDDVRPEEVTPSYAGASARVDFLLKKEKIVVEVKMASMKLRDKEVGGQLIVDIARYQSHPDCKTLVCFVYDPSGCIRNPVGLESDLSRKHNGMDVRVFVVPH